MITIIAVGKKHEDWILHGLERYEKRLKQPYNTKWILLPHSTKHGAGARKMESELIYSQLSLRDYVVLLDETGTIIDSPHLSDVLEGQFTNARPLVLIIGGAYGVDDGLKARADFVWSLSRLVFPHQLVRLLVVEQLYRAQEISRGGSYHHI